MRGNKILEIKPLQILGWLLLGTQVLAAAARETQTSEEKQADPRQLLRTVAEARYQIASGEMEFDLTRIDFGHPLEGTNHTRVKVVFDGEKRRCESFTREYFSVLRGPGAGEVTDAKLKELKLVRGEAAAKTGLLRPCDQHRVTAYDGVQLLELSDISTETGSSFFETKIEDPAKHGGSFGYDPRILGLTPTLGVDHTIESRLRYSQAELVTLVGAESVEGLSTWHVRASYRSIPNSTPTDFWIHTNCPSHVVKCACNGDTVFSKYDLAYPEDPLPVEIRTVRYYGLERGRLEESIVRRTARYNVPVAAASWTLAGLKMPLGTEVVDDRISRSLGYWSGTGLSDNPPPRPETAPTNEPKTSTDAAKLMELVKSDPESLFAAQVYFTLATRLKGGVTEGIDDRRSAEAERLLQRTIAAADKAGASGLKLTNAAHEELSQLQHWYLGRLAPEIEGEDMEGRKMRLSDFRSNVVVVTFWATWCPVCMAMIPEERKLVERLAGKPFSLVGVNSDSVADQAKVRATMEKNGISWRSFRDGGRTGPIASAWNVQNWPTTYVLDRKGVVRYRNVQGQALADAVNAILREGS
jgi:thiol-disulfide isomerase/thioredoxin